MISDQDIKKTTEAAEEDGCLNAADAAADEAPNEGSLEAADTGEEKAGDTNEGKAGDANEEETGDIGEEKAEDASEDEAGDTNENEESAAEPESESADDSKGKADGDNKSDNKKERKFFKKKKDKKDEKIEELTDKLTRQMAEFDNYRKRTDKEKAANYALGAKDVIEKLLPVIDNFERGLADADLKDPFADGMDKTYKQLTTLLKDLGVTQIEAVGKEFDPNLHNAVMHVDDEELGENVVAEEFQKGYLYKDQVVRHSMVKVAN